MSRSLSARRDARRLAADAGLLVVAAAFVLPLAWVVLSAVDPHAGLRVKTPTGSPSATSTRSSPTRSPSPHC
ncbi:hypothetical protein SHKM778_17840 [Streptomyces sp. KM77-8]|uniref:Carbohydrate ABC transporter permease n=1 Tax=Streptomyces haneummycinicus TaxID=3074435 RepID=A0AAT9HDL3_9ACTN